MDMPKTMREARLQKRYKRFLADVELPNGETLTAHCPNPGAMMGLTAQGSRVWISMSDNKKRKLPATLEIVEADDTLVGINTMRPNALVEDALGRGLIEELASFETLKREVKYGKNSRIDILLDADTSPIYVEVKNVHLMRQSGLAEFPDCVTARGAKHLDELGDMADAGFRAAMVFLIQRSDCDRLDLADDLDPAYAQAFDKAITRGVEAYALACHVSPETILAERAIQIVRQPRTE